MYISYAERAYDIVPIVSTHFAFQHLREIGPTKPALHNRFYHPLLLKHHFKDPKKVKSVAAIATDFKYLHHCDVFVNIKSIDKYFWSSCIVSCQLWNELLVWLQKCQTNSRSAEKNASWWRVGHGPESSQQRICSHYGWHIPGVAVTEFGTGRRRWGQLFSDRRTSATGQQPHAANDFPGKGNCKWWGATRQKCLPQPVYGCRSTDTTGCSKRCAQWYKQFQPQKPQCTTAEKPAPCMARDPPTVLAHCTQKATQGHRSFNWEPPPVTCVVRYPTGRAVPSSRWPRPKLWPLQRRQRPVLTISHVRYMETFPSMRRCLRPARWSMLLPQQL